MVDIAAVLSHRIKRLEEQNATKAASVEEHLSDHFRVAVSCPPDTQIHVRGGNVWDGTYWISQGAGYYVEADSADFSDAATIDGYTGNFTNAGYYIGVVFGRAYYNGEDWFCVGGGTEYATAAEAEAYIEDVALLAAPWKGYDLNGGLPLAGVVLRNDGRTGVDGAVLPVDRVNRGRSYYWKDLRPRHYIDYNPEEPM